MTPSALKDLLLSSLIVLLLLFTKQISAQPDTLIIYEYIRVVDTVWIEKDHSEIPQLSNIEPIVNIAIPPKPPKDLLVLQNHTPNSATLFENGIIKSGNSNKAAMKKISILGLTLFSLSSAINAQTELHDRFGFYLKGNLATQVHSYPGADLYPAYSMALYPDGYVNVDYYTEEAYGKYGERDAPTVGLGARYEHNFNSVFGFITNAGYLQRGSREGSAFFSNGNKFHNLNLDAILKISTHKRRFIEPYFYTGLRGDFTLARSITYNIDKNANPFGESSYYGFHRFNYSFVTGVGCDLCKKYFLEFEFNNDIGYLARNEILKVRNQMVSINLGFYLGEAPKYKMIMTE